jgi:hypothetical protein
MNLLHKFYDIAATDTGAETQVVDQPSIAELMAKQGYNSEDRPAQVQVENKGENEQTETQVEVQAAIVGTETKVEEVVQETKTPVAEAATIPVVEEKPQTTITWQEVLKQQQPDTVLKELLGVDDTKIGLLKTVKDLPPQVVGLIDTWKSNGDLVAYLKEMTTDYSKMSSEDVMRSQFRLEYPRATEKAIEALFKKEIIEAYQLDPDKYSDEEVEEGRLLLDAKADRFRDTLTQRQQQFLIPKAPEQAAQVETDNTEEIETARMIEERKAYVSNDPFVKNMFSTKQFTLGEGEEAFNFQIDPVALTDILFDGNKWAEAINDVSLNEKGEKMYKPRPEHQALVSLVAKYGKGFLDAYAQHFKTIGAKKVIEPLDNAKPPVNNNSSATQIAPQSAAEAMARSGRLV